MLHRISKCQAKKIFNRGGLVYLCPCKFLPAGPFSMAVNISGNEYLHCAEVYDETSDLWKGSLEETAWSIMYNRWHFYNASYETGYYAHYYIEGNDWVFETKLDNDYKSSYDWLFRYNYFNIEREDVNYTARELLELFKTIMDCNDLDLLCELCSFVDQQGDDLRRELQSWLKRRIAQSESETWFIGSNLVLHPIPYCAIGWSIEFVYLRSV